MRIAHIHKYFHSQDGASRYERGLMRLQEEAGHAVAPFAMRDSRNAPSPWSEYFVSNIDTRRVGFGVDAIRQAGRALWSREAERKCGAMLDAFRPHVVHAHNVYTHLSPSVLHAVKKRSIPVVMTVHDYALVSANYALWNGTKPMDLAHLGVLATTRTRYIKHSYLATLALEATLKLHHALRMYDGVIVEYVAFSTFMADVMVSAGFDQKKITVLHPFAEPLLSPISTTKKQASSTVLFAGRLEGYKGVRVLLDSLKMLPKDAEIHIAGTGPEEQFVRDVTRRDARVTYLGFVPGEELWRRMRQVAVVVVPSLWHEPYGLVALEAMCQGTPVIVAKRGGLPEVVGSESAGIVVPAGDAGALGRAITRVLSDEDFAQNMGERAKERAERIGNPQEHLDKVLKIYSRCG